MFPLNFKTAWELTYLIECPRCGAKYSKICRKCPKCGELNPLVMEAFKEAEGVLKKYEKWLKQK